MKTITIQQRIIGKLIMSEFVQGKLDSQEQASEFMRKAIGIID